MNSACAIALNWNSLVGLRKQLVGDEQHDRLLEQAVVEGAEELGREQRAGTAARAAGGKRSGSKPGGAGFHGVAGGIASFAEAAKPYNA